MSEIWTIKKLLDWSFDYFTKHNIDSPKVTSQILLAHVLNTKRINLFLKYNELLSDKSLQQYKQLLLRRINHEPTEYILGDAEFFSLTFDIDKRVLIPRPETEILVTKVLDELVDKKHVEIVDIGTGSGVIAVSIKKNRPDLTVWATDISQDALSVAMENAIKNGVELNGYNGFYPSKINSNEKKIIVSNPPYIKSAVINSLMPEVKDFEPNLALDGGEDGLNVIRDIFDLYKQDKNIIAMLIEIGYDQKESIEELTTNLEFSIFEVIKDYNKLDRIVRIVR